MSQLLGALSTASQVVSRSIASCLFVPRLNVTRRPRFDSHTYSQKPDIHIAAWPMLHPWGKTEQWAHCDEAVSPVAFGVAGGNIPLILDIVI